MPSSATPISRPGSRLSTSGAWRKKTLTDLEGFDERFLINQDYELNHRLRKAGGKILLSPEIKCRYHVRPTLAKLAKQYFKYGQGRVQTMRRHPDSLRWRQLAAPAFVTGIAFTLALSVLWPDLWKLYLGFYGLVAILAAACSALSARQLTLLPVLPVIMASIHVAWGCGFLVGLATTSLTEEVTKPVA